MWRKGPHERFQSVKGCIVWHREELGIIIKQPFNSSPLQHGEWTGVLKFVPAFCVVLCNVAVA
jgi:hypothetical protein